MLYWSEDEKGQKLNMVKEKMKYNGHSSCLKTLSTKSLFILQARPNCILIIFFTDEEFSISR